MVWLASTVLLVAAGIGVFLHAAWWPTLAVAGALCSLIAILPWLKTVPGGAYAGAVLDVIILITLLSPLKDRLLQALA